MDIGFDQRVRQARLHDFFNGDDLGCNKGTTRCNGILALCGTIHFTSDYDDETPFRRTYMGNSPFNDFSYCGFLWYDMDCQSNL